MHTHLNLIYEQLCTLMDLLIEQAHMLLAQDPGPGALGYRDDLEALVQTVGQFALRLDQAERQALSHEESALLVHDLRAPLRDVMGLSELLLNNADDMLTPRQCQLLQHVYATSYDLLDVVDDLFGESSSH
ncbi:MAG: hypothetical protein K8J31_31360 [Anaerolineae bacterium]|nr:hypothetical protein [Anaerolineae bacterium]